MIKKKKSNANTITQETNNFTYKKEKKNPH